MTLKDEELALLIEAAHTGVKERSDSKSLIEREIEAYIRSNKLEVGPNAVGLDTLFNMYLNWTDRPMEYNKFLAALRKHFNVRSNKGPSGGASYIHLNAELLGLPSYYSFTSDPNVKSNRKFKERKYLGVFKLARDRYYAKILLPTGKYLPLGTYKLETQAAYQYDRAALQVYGKEAVLNFPKKWKPLLDGEKDIPEDLKEKFNHAFYKGLKEYRKYQEEQEQYLKQVQALSGQAEGASRQGDISSPELQEASKTKT